MFYTHFLDSVFFYTYWLYGVHWCHWICLFGGMHNCKSGKKKIAGANEETESLNMYLYLFPHFCLFLLPIFGISFPLYLSACSLLILLPSPPQPSMQLEGTFVSEAWRLCSGAVHLQLDEHLTPESVLHRAHTCIYTGTHIEVKENTHKCFPQKPSCTRHVVYLPCAYSLVWDCVRASVCMYACEAAWWHAFIICFEFRDWNSLYFWLSHSLSLLCPFSIFSFLSIS